MTLYAIILNILKYVGLAIASAATIWTATNITSKEVNGKKELTTAGRVSIIFTLSGLAISITSNILEEKLKAKKASQQAIAEIKRTNKIILSGQPLLQLTLSIQCNGDFKDFKQFSEVLHDEYIEEATNQQGEVSSSKGDAIQFAHGVFPLFMKSITGEDRRSEDFLFLISLDEHQNNVLSYGYVNDWSVLDIQNGGYDSSESKRTKYSKGILSDEDVWKPAYYGGNKRISDPGFGSTEDGIRFEWNLDSSTLFDCLNKLKSHIPLSANLSPIIKVAILYNLKKLPVENENMTSSFGEIWGPYNCEDEQESDAVKNIYTNSALYLTPNQLDNETLTYSLESVCYKKILDEEWQEQLLCNEILLIYRKVEDA